MVKNYIKKWKRNRALSLSDAFELVLGEAKEKVYCDKIIRTIPGKRWVVFGKWGDQEVVAKLFCKKRQLQCDLEGVSILLQENVPTPRLLYQGTGKIENKKIEVLLFERITQAENLDVVWQEKKDRYESVECIELMNNVITEIATQHVLGIQQLDLHLKNFLVKDKIIYTLDGGGIKKNPPTLDKKSSLKNLGLFFSQLGVGTELLKKELFKTYSRLRGWVIKKSDFIILEKEITYNNKKRRRQYHKKVFRNCTAFLRINKFNKSIVCDRHYQSAVLMDFFDHPEKLFSHSDSIILKAGRSATVAKIFLDGRWLVVKRYNIKNYWHWLRRCLRATRAATSWRLAQQLNLFGVSTAKPVAYVENHFLGLRGTSYFIMEFVAGGNVGEFFATQPEEDEATSTIAKTIAGRILDLFHCLGELKMTHGDLKMTNILLENEKPVLIDLDGMREHATIFSFKRAFQKEIKRFMKNWEQQPRIYAIFYMLCCRG